MAEPGAPATAVPTGPAAWLRRAWSVAAVRYLCVGGTLFVIGVVVLLGAVRGLGLDVRIGEGISRVVGAAVGFFGHKYVSFRDREGRQALSFAGQGASYAILSVVNVFVAPWVLYLLYLALAPHLLVAKIISDAIMVCETYVLLRLIFWSRGSARQG